MVPKALQKLCLAILMVAGTATLCAAMYALSKGLVSETFQTCKEK